MVSPSLCVRRLGTLACQHQLGFSCRRKGSQGFPVTVGKLASPEVDVADVESRVGQARRPFLLSPRLVPSCDLPQHRRGLAQTHLLLPPMSRYLIDCLSTGIFLFPGDRAMIVSMLMLELNPKSVREVLATLNAQGEVSALVSGFSHKETAVPGVCLP